MNQEQTATAKSMSVTTEDVVPSAHNAHNLRYVNSSFCLVGSQDTRARTMLK